MGPGHDETAVQQRAIHVLRERQRHAAADVLTACELAIEPDGSGLVVALALRAPAATEARYLDPTTGIREDICAALRDALPPGTWIEGLVLHVVPDEASTASPPPGWSAPPRAPSDEDVHNQATGFQTRREWQNLRFRSESELRIAQALERAGVLFLPNCKARLGPATGRTTREPDFLICSHGKWGILEVDGEPYHPPKRTAAEHERDRLFKQHGVWVVEHFDASRCFATPDAVVQEFLAILDGA